MNIIRVLAFAVLAATSIFGFTSGSWAGDQFVAKDHFLFDSLIDGGVEGPACVTPCIPILKVIRTIEIGGINTAQRIQLANMDETFVGNFLPKVEDPVRPATLTLYQLTQPAAAADVVKALGSRVEVSMGQLYVLLQKQKSTESGFIPEVDMSHLFIKDANGRMAEVYLRQSNESIGWSISANYLDEFSNYSNTDLAHITMWPETDAYIIAQ